MSFAASFHQRRTETLPLVEQLSPVLHFLGPPPQFTATIGPALMTRSLPPLSLLPFVGLAFAIVGCGARTSLGDPSGGDGGATSTGVLAGPSVVSSTSGTSGPCTGFRLDGDPYVIPEVAFDASSPDLALMPDGDMIVTWFAGATVLGDPTLNPSEEWPDPIDAMNGLTAPTVTDYVAGPGIDGPVLYARDEMGGGWLTRGLFNVNEEVPVASFGGTPMFAVGAPNRYLYADGDGNGFLTVGSYQPGGLPQDEAPMTCLSSPAIGAAVSKGEGFVAAYTESDPPGQSCLSQVPQPGRAIVTMRYEPLSNEPGAPLEVTTEEVLVHAEPVAHLALASTGFGAWLVYQTDGSTSEVMPAIQARLLDHGGKLQPFASGPFPVSPQGITTPEVIAANLDDALALLWVDTTVPDAPTLFVQRVEGDGSLGASIAVPTNVASLSGRVRMIATSDARSLIVTWEGDGATSVALAKIDCVN